MKRVVLLSMCIFTLSCVQIQAQTTGGKKNKGFKTIKTNAGKSVIPSYRSTLSAKA